MPELGRRSLQKLDQRRNHELKLADLDERVDERYAVPSRKRCSQPGDRAALKRLLSRVARGGHGAPAPYCRRSRRRTRYSRGSVIICDGNAGWRRGPLFATYCRLSAPPGSCAEVCPAGASDLGKIGQEDVTRHIERHARDRSAASGKAMCWSLRAFLRYLHHKGLTPLALADCVPSIRRWKLASLPTYLSAAQVQKVLDGCDRATAMGRRDYAILMMLAKLGLRAGEVATLTLDDIDWRSGEMLIRAKGRQRARMPMPPDVGAAVVACLRDSRPTSSCRRLFLRTLAPHVGFASGCAITMIAKTSLERAIAAAPTVGPISSDTALPPSFSDPARPCQRSASCCDTRAMTPRASTRRWISRDSAH